MTEVPIICVRRFGLAGNEMKLLFKFKIESEVDTASNQGSSVYEGITTKSILIETGRIVIAHLLP